MFGFRHKVSFNVSGIWQLGEDTEVSSVAEGSQTGDELISFVSFSISFQIIYILNISRLNTLYKGYVI